jgi:hypothetical protein
MIVRSLPSSRMSHTLPMKRSAVVSDLSEYRVRGHESNAKLWRKRFSLYRMIHVNTACGMSKK